jgi:hypothetical protein
VNEPTSEKPKGLRYLVAATLLVLGVGYLTSNIHVAPTPAVSGAARQGTDTANSEQDNQPDVASEEERHSTGGVNRVNLVNRTDGRMRIKGRIQLTHTESDTATPYNEAYATGSCTNCQTFAVALQIALISRTATTIAPVNQAVALNDHCSHCLTVALAYQYVVQVDDPEEVPDDVAELVRSMQREMQDIAHDRSQTLTEAETRLDGVINRFQALGASLYRTEDQAVDDSQTPEAGRASTPVPSRSASTPTPTAAPARNASTPAPTATPASTATPEPTATPTPTPVPATPTPTPAAY